jgi:glycosyltransferase involved in cell wall biosynthesis
VIRIGLVTGEYPPQQGGVGDFTRELARALIAAGHEAQVITTAISGQRLAASPKREDGMVVQRVIKSWGMGCWRQLGDVVQRERLDVLNIQYEPAAYGMQAGVNFLPSAWARRQIKTPIVTTFHDLLVPYLFPKAGPLRWQVVDYLARHSAAVIVTNGEDYARLSNLRRPISNLHTIPIGSNIDPVLAGEFDRAAERARWGIQPAEFLLGYFGFLNLSKGGADLMQALKTLSVAGHSVKLLLMGGRTGSSDPTNAAYAAEVERLIASLGVSDRVIATGYLEPPAVSRALAACDVLVLPYVDGASLRRGSLLAAIAHGKAIVTTEPRYPIEGLRQNESAWFVAAKDPQSIAAAVQQILRNRALRSRLESGAGDAAKLYTWDRIAAQTIAVFENVLRATPAGRAPRAS